jgi:hypothetical protein
MMTEKESDTRRIRQQLRTIEILVQSRRIGPAAAGAPAVGAY